MKHPNDPLPEAVSLTDMARTVGLSRGRFYQLVKSGVFPRPSRNKTTGRPYYNRKKQDDCIRIRRTNCGMNGRPILFYCRRIDGRTDDVRPPTARRDPPSRKSPQNAFIRDLRDALVRLGIPASAPDTAIQTAVRECFPDGHAETDLPTIVTAVYRQLARKDSPSNAAG